MNFVPEGGQPVVIVHEWSPGVEVVQGFGADGAPLMTVLSESGPGVKPVFVTPGTLPLHLDPAAQAAQAAQHAAAAYQAQLGVASSAAMGVASSAAAAQAGVDRATPAALLLLL